MHKTMRESKMLEQVRRWRAEAYESVRRQPLDARLRRAHEWAERLGLPISDDDAKTHAAPGTPTPNDRRDP